MKKALFLCTCVIITVSANWQRVIGSSDEPLAPIKEVIKSDTNGLFTQIKVFGFNTYDTLIDNKTFKCIDIPDEFVDSDTIRAGKPRVPYIRLLIAVPDSCGFNFTIYTTDYMRFDDYLIYPIPRIIYEDSAGIFVYKEIYTYDTVFYQKDTLYPNKFYEIKSESHWRDQRVLEVFLYPVQFNPQKKLMCFYPGIDLKIEYTGSKFPNANGLGPCEDIGREILLNYPGIDKELPSRPPPAVHYYTDLLDTGNVADYIIVTHYDFLNNKTTKKWIQDFAQWRVDHNQFDVAIVKVQDIYEQFGPAGHDSTQLRNFLIYAYDNWRAPAMPDGHFAYCLFIGDWDYVPTCFREYEAGGNMWLGALDYYFANFEGYGCADIMLGRWPVKVTKIEDLITIAQKSINYEKYPDTAGDWRRQGLLIAGCDASWNKYLTESKPYFSDIDYDTVAVRQSALTAQGFSDSLNKYFNEGEILALYFDHGDPKGWWNYDTTDLKGHRNDKRLPVILSNACLTAMFQWDHPFYDSSHFRPGSDSCFGELFLKNPRGGAVAFFGATEYSYIPDYATMLKLLFWYQHWILGKFLIPGLTGCYCLLGDPALDLGDYTAYPDLPDLVVRPQGIDIELFPPYPYPKNGDTIPIQFAVWNIGGATANDVALDFKIILGGNTIDSTRVTIDEIQPRDSAVTRRYWDPATAYPYQYYGEIGDCKFEVTADPESQIQESWEGNNTSSLIKKVALYPNQAGWPKEVRGFSQPALGDLDGFGGVEIVYAGLDSVYVFNYNGSVLLGWPQCFAGVYAVVIGDVDNNNYLEVVAVSPESIKVYDYQGNVLSGWPQPVPYYPDYRFYGYPALGHITGSSQRQVVMYCGATPAQPAPIPAKIVVYDYDGVFADTFTLLHESVSGNNLGVAIADVTGDNQVEMVISYVARQGSYTEVYNRDGYVTVLSGGSDWSIPALVDLTGDGIADVIYGCIDSLIRAYDTAHDRRLWERPTEGPINSSPAVGDIYPAPYSGVEITFGNDGSAINLRRNDNGLSIPPWSFIVSPSTWVRTSPAITNINGDANLDIIIGANNQYIYAFNYNITLIAPFPLPLFGIDHSSPIIGDIDGDGNSEIVIASSDGYLHIWKNLNSQVTQYLLEWPQYHHDYQRTGLYGWSP